MKKIKDSWNIKKLLLNKIKISTLDNDFALFDYLKKVDIFKNWVDSIKTLLLYSESQQHFLFAYTYVCI